MSDAELKGYPPIRDKSFVYYIGVIGEISCGKSTFINGLFGDCLTEAGSDRTTVAPYRFFESVAIKDNKSLAHRTRVTNKNQQIKQEWDRQQKEREQSWINWRSKTPTLSQFYSYRVAPSTLIPHREYDNLFCITDFPGFNDSKFDDQIFSVLKQNRNKFDCLIYVLDCNKCLTEKHSQIYFEKIVGIIQQEIVSGKLKLMLVFNKYDLLGRRAQQRKMLEEMKRKIETDLQINYRVPSDKLITFNISASRLLAERIVLDKDMNYLLKNMTLIDDIDDYAGKFFGDREIQRLQDTTSEQERLLIYHQEAQKEARDFYLQEESKNNSYALKLAFRKLRSPMSISTQIEKKLSDFALSGRYAKQQRQPFLQTASLALECLTRCRNFESDESQDEKNNVQDINDARAYVEFKKRLQAVLIKQINTLVVTLQNELKSARKDRKRSEMLVLLVTEDIINCFAKLQASLVVLDQSYITRLGQSTAASGLITSNVLGQLKGKIDMKKGLNAQYFHILACGFVDKMIKSFGDPSASSNYYDFWYIKDNISTVINHITEFYAENKKLQREYLSKILFPYDQKIDRSKTLHGRAIDMMQFYMSMDQIRSLCNEFKQFSNLCCKVVQHNDQVFCKLLEALSRTW